MIFPVLSVEAVVQVGDKTRLNAAASFLSGADPADVITLIEIQPEDGGDWYDVTSAMYLDWAYATAGAKVPMVRVTSTSEAPTSKAGAITALTAAADLLFSNDANLMAHQSDILKYLPEGKATFLYEHRRVQTLMLDWLAKEGYLDATGFRLTKAAITVNEDVESWATYLCLALVFEDASNVVDDIFASKSKGYYGKAVNARDRAILSLDLNGDGVTDIAEKISTRGCIVRRR